MNNIKIIATDLDGTLLRTNKELSQRNIDALRRASEAGVYIVPSTGRSYSGMPEDVTSLEFIRYAVTINGAKVHDVLGIDDFYNADMTVKQALEIADIIKAYPVVWDVYVGSNSYMAAEHMDSLESYVSDPAFNRTIRQFRKRTKDNRELIEKSGSVQKINLYSEDHRMLADIKTLLLDRYSDLSVTSSIPDNIEINNIRANKGDALLALASHLGYTAENVMAFGDGENDLSMIQAAGLGVVMENAVENMKSAADYITKTNDEDGVAFAIEKFVL